jgi:hypothetical protein
MRKAWLKNIAAVAAMFGVCGTAFAQKLVTQGDYVLWGSVLVQYQGSDAVVNIPAYFGITEIADEAFSRNATMRSVTIPPGVVSIGSGAFVRCWGLTEITVDPRNTAYSSIDGVLFDKTGKTLVQYPLNRIGAYAIPAGVVYIGAGAFSGCNELTGVTIPPGVAYIGKDAFSGCFNLSRIIIPASVFYIEKGAFLGCYGLTAITADPRNTAYSSIDGVLFDKAGKTLVQCPIKKTGAYSIPMGVAAVGDRAFAFCAGLTSVTIPPGVTSIEYGAFSYCAGLTSVSIPAGVTYIGDSAFEWCDKLINVSIPNSVSAIGDRAFAYCSRLTSVTIPPSVAFIGYNTFSNCVNLRTVFLSRKTRIGSDAFPAGVQLVYTD